MTVHRIRACALAVAAACAVVACGVLPVPQAAQDEESRQEVTSGPIRIGFVYSQSGSLAGAGADMAEGLELWLAENDGKMAGREVELITEDDQGNTEMGVQVTKRLVEADDVDIVIGPLAGNVGVALGQYVKTVDTPLVYPIPTSDVFVHDNYPNVFPVTGTAPQFNGPMGEYAAAQGYDEVATICSDYAFGQQVCGGFVSGYTDAGGEVTEQIWAPLNSSDYAPFISQVRSSGADAVFSGLVGADSVKFLNAWRSFGMDDEMALLGSDPSFDQAVLRGVGESSLGLVSVGHFVEGRADPATEEFTAAYREAYDGKVPSYYSASGYLAGDWTARALEENGGKVGEADEFVDVMAGIAYDDSLFGPITVDERGQPVYTVYLREVTEGPSGTPWNTVLDEYPEIGATGPLSYDEYLDQPIYSREYQGFPEERD